MNKQIAVSCVEIFWISFVFFCFFFLCEFMKPGFVGNVMNLNVVFFVCMVSGILAVLLLPDQKEL